MKQTNKQKNKQKHQFQNFANFLFGYGNKIISYHLLTLLVLWVNLDKCQKDRFHVIDSINDIWEDRLANVSIIFVIGIQNHQVNTVVGYIITVAKI